MEDEEGQEMNETRIHLRKMNKIMAGSSRNQESRMKKNQINQRQAIKMKKS